MVPALAQALDGRVRGLYVGGSLATGDYRPPISDIDAVALLDGPLDRAGRTEIARIHRALSASGPDGAALHCVYVPRDEVVDLARKHWTWAFDELFRRPLSAIARAELLADPIVVLGPPPSSWLSPMSAGDLRQAARAELEGYWRGALRKRAIWLEDTYFDLGLTVWARADATIGDGVLITKTEAIDRLRRQGLPAEIVDGIAARRAGRTRAITDEQRSRRADIVRAFLHAEFARLSSTP